MPDGLSVSVLPESSFDGLSVSVLPESLEPLSVLPESPLDGVSDGLSVFVLPESSDPLSVLPESSLDGTSVPDGLSVSFFGVSGFVGVASCLTGVHCATAVASEPLSSMDSPESTLTPSMVQPSNS